MLTPQDAPRRSYSSGSYPSGARAWAAAGLGLLALAAASCSVGSAPSPPDHRRPDLAVAAERLPGQQDGASPQPSLCVTRDGERLKARHWTAADGARLFADWLDTKRDEPCSFRSTLDGKLRCLPTSSTRLPVSQMFYRDSGCKQPVVAVKVEVCTAAPRYALFYTESCPRNQHQVWSVGSQEKLSTIYAKNSTSGCQIAPIDEGAIYYGLVAEVLPSEFVAATISLEAKTRLRVPTVVAEDGALQGCRPERIYDSTLEAHCSLSQKTVDGKRRCLPRGNQQGAFHADPACSSKLARAEDGCVAPDPFLSVWQGVHCVQTALQEQLYRVYRLGDRPSAYYVLSGSPPACNPVADPVTDHYLVGAEVEPSAFAEVTIEQQGTGRLRERYYESADGFALSTQSFTDSARGAATCTLEVAVDRRRRCLPSYYFPKGVSTYYEDSNCLKPISLVELERPVGCPSPPLPTTLRVRDSSSCPTGYRVHALGAKVVVAKAYRREGDSCVPVEIDTSHMEQFQLGAEIPAESFVEFTLQ